MTPQSKEEKRKGAILREIDSWNGHYDRIPYSVRERVRHIFHNLTDQNKMAISNELDVKYSGKFQQWLNPQPFVFEKKSIIISNNK